MLIKKWIKKNYTYESSELKKQNWIVNLRHPARKEIVDQRKYLPSSHWLLLRPCPNSRYGCSLLLHCVVCPWNVFRPREQVPWPLKEHRWFDSEPWRDDRPLWVRRACRVTALQTNNNTDDKRDGQCRLCEYSPAKPLSLIRLERLRRCSPANALDIFCTVQREKTCYSNIQHLFRWTGQ